MRKFLCDSESVITLEEVREVWEDEYKDYGTSFEEYLENCMTRNNGMLDEILTAETPAKNRRGAVMLCAVFDEGDDAEFPWVVYLSAAEIAQQKRYGKIVTAYLGEWC